MLTINDYIRHQIRSQSDKIHALKESARKVIATVKCYGYIDPQTKLPYPGYGTGCDAPPKEIREEKKLFFDSYMEDKYDHIRPALPQWKEYIFLKKDVSLWLSALNLSRGDWDKKWRCHHQTLEATQTRLERATKMINKYNSFERKNLKNHELLENIEKEIEHEKALRASA